MDDNSLMPFGKYKTVKMQDVPADYLHWLWSNGLKNQIKTNEVAKYIQDNLDALKMEYKDGIWS